MKKNYKMTVEDLKQEHRGIKFHSIYFRYVLFIFAVIIMFFCVIGGVDSYIGWGQKGQIITVGQLGFVLNIVLGALFVGCSFVNWKISIYREGIYIKKIDLFVPWAEIAGVSHVWINEFSLTSRVYLYNRKTIVIYRKETKPICVYNISVFALWVVKIYAPSIKTNFISATTAMVVNVILSGVVFYFGYALKLEDEWFVIYFFWTVLYIVKCLAIPLIMMKIHNRRWGYYLHYATACQKNSLDCINI